MCWLPVPTSGSPNRVDDDADTPAAGVMTIDGSAAGLAALCDGATSLPENFAFMESMAEFRRAYGLAATPARRGAAPATDTSPAAQHRDIDGDLQAVAPRLYEKSRLAIQLVERATSPPLRQGYCPLAIGAGKALAVLRERPVEAETKSRPDDG